jgi:hypothetical protein
VRRFGASELDDVPVRIRDVGVRDAGRVLAALEEHAAGPDDLVYCRVEVLAFGKPEPDVAGVPLRFRARVEREDLAAAEPDEDELVTDSERLLRAERGTVEAERELDVPHVQVNMVEARGSSHHEGTLTVLRRQSEDGRKISFAITSRWICEVPS